MQAVNAVVGAVLRPKIEPINSTEEAFHCVFRPCDPDSLSVNSRQPHRILREDQKRRLPGGAEKLLGLCRNSGRLVGMHLGRKTPSNGGCRLYGGG